MWILRCTMLFWLVLCSAVRAENVVRLSAPEQHPVREVAIRVLKTAYAEIGYSVDVINLPPARSLFMANEGLVDGELFRGDRIERDFKKLIRIPVAIAEGQIVVAVNRNRKDIRVSDWQALAPYSIGAQLGIKTVQMNTEGMAVNYVAQADQLILQLLYNRIDVAVGPKDVFLRALTQMATESVNERLPLDDIVLLKPALETGYLYHYLHESQIDLAVNITRVMTRMEEEGVIAAIRNEVMAERFKALQQLH